MQLRKYTLKLTTKFFRNIIRCLVFTGNIAENAWKRSFRHHPSCMNRCRCTHTTVMLIRKNEHRKSELCKRPNTLVRLVDGTAGVGISTAKSQAELETKENIHNWKAFDAAFRPHTMPLEPCACATICTLPDQNSKGYSIPGNSVQNTLCEIFLCVLKHLYYRYQHSER